MKCNDMFSWKAGEIVTIHTGHYKCNICGKEVDDLVYSAMATDDYTTDSNGVYRRKFVYVGRPPVCDCSNAIWLSK